MRARGPEVPPPQLDNMTERLFAVSQWRGQESGWRKFSGELPKSDALRRANLVGRLFPEFASPRVTSTRD